MNSRTWLLAITMVTMISGPVGCGNDDDGGGGQVVTCDSAIERICSECNQWDTMEECWDAWQDDMGCGGADCDPPQDYLSCLYESPCGDLNACYDAYQQTMEGDVDNDCTAFCDLCQHCMDTYSDFTEYNCEEALAEGVDCVEYCEVNASEVHDALQGLVKPLSEFTCCEYLVVI